MASFGDVDLLLGEGGGAIFELSDVSDDVAFSYAVATGGEVILPPNKSVAIVRGLPLPNFEDGMAVAREVVNKALDFAATTGATPVFLDHHKQPEIVWWQHGGQITLRVLSVTSLTMRFRATAEVRDANGDLVRQAAPARPEWAECLRFYRTSEASTDLFDSFRNLYLAIESLLSALEPPRVGADGRLEGEGAWLARVLRDVSEVDLTPFAPAGPKDPHNGIHEELYVGLRTAIFHAKRGKRAWLPQHWNDRDQIIDARERYAKMFRALAEKHVGVRFGGSGLSKHGFAVTAGAILEAPTVFVSDDPTRHQDEPKGLYEIAPAGGRVTEMPTRPAVEFSDDWTAGVFGSDSGSRVMANVDGIHRFGTLRDGELAFVENLADILKVDGIDVVEVVMLGRNRNYGAPRRDFAS